MLSRPPVEEVSFRAKGRIRTLISLSNQTLNRPQRVGRQALVALTPETAQAANINVSSQYKGLFESVNTKCCVVVRSETQADFSHRIRTVFRNLSVARAVNLTDFNGPNRTVDGANWGGVLTEPDQHVSARDAFCSEPATGQPFLHTTQTFARHYPAASVATC